MNIIKYIKHALFDHSKFKKHQFSTIFLSNDLSRGDCIATNLQLKNLIYNFFFKLKEKSNLAKIYFDLIFTL